MDSAQVLPSISLMCRSVPPALCLISDSPIGQQRRKMQGDGRRQPVSAVSSFFVFGQKYHRVGCIL